jgi:thioredoxin reductase (NADPH)
MTQSDGDGSQDDVYDITIIGAGPTGLFAAFYAGLRGMQTKIIEALPEPGGQLATLYPEKYIYDVPGHREVLAKDLVRLLVEQTNRFAPTFVHGERIQTLTRAAVHGEEVWRVGSVTSSHLTRTVLITAGIGAFEPNRLDRPGVADYAGSGVFYFVTDKQPLHGKRILIIGGGDAAVDWALNLEECAGHITLIHRRDGFRAHESSIARLRTANIPIMVFWELKHIEGDGKDIKTAVILNSKTGKERELNIDIVLINTGFKANLGAIEGWGLEMADVRHIRTNGFMETNLPGVFAAGDIASVEGSVALNLIVAGFGQAAIAANAAKQKIDPTSSIFPGYTSELNLA